MPGIGTPGFVGARLREARDARGVSAITLAELVGTTPQAIYQYQSGKVNPPPDKLFLIASKLSLPVDFFLQPARAQPDRLVFYRSQAATTAAARHKAEARLLWLEDIVLYLQQFIEYPPVAVPDLHEEAAAQPVTMPLPAGHVEAAAAKVRAAWGIDDGPISNVLSLVEGHGAVGTRGVMETLTIDAFSTRLEPSGRPCLFLGADKDSAARSRFDTAHELGHAVLHGGIKKGSLTNSQWKGIETDANRFASAFLLPHRAFARDLRAPTLEAMLAAKERWMVSVGVMIRRCSDLEILHPAEADRLWILRTKRGWHRHEPLDSDLPFEQPMLLRRAVELIVSEGVRTPSQIVNDLRLNPADIESLTNLNSGYLTEQPPPVRLIDRKSVNGETHSHKGSLVEFRRA